MNPIADSNAAWLDKLLAESAMPAPRDDGFSARVMARIDALPAPALPAAAAPCVSAAEALARAPALQLRDRRRWAWQAGGLLAAGGIAALVAWTQPGPVGTIAVALALASLPLWLLRDPSF